MLSRTRFEVHVLCGDQTRPSVGVLGRHSGMVLFNPVCAESFYKSQTVQAEIFLFLRLIPCFPTAVGQSRVLNHAKEMFAYSVV